MELTVHRKYRKETYTIGNLYINGEFFCNTMEDKDRGLKQTDDIAHIKAVKVPSETAIPVGRYNVSMDVISPKYSGVAFYRDLCGGRVPRVMDVPGFDGILIHAGNTAADTAGCLLVGSNKAKGKVLESKATFTELYGRMKKAHDAGEEITIEYVW